MTRIKILEIYLIIYLVAAVVALLYVWFVSPLGTSDRVGITMAISTVSLVIVTGIYAWHARKQADASVKMATEMREQRRPIVVQEAIESKGIAFSIGDGEDIEHNPSDYFQIRNVGNGPAIELEMMTLNEKKNLLEMQRKMVFSQADPPMKFHPPNLVEHVNSTCYFLCRYRSVLSPNVRQIWYETELPFEPVKAQSGDKIIIKPGELEFREVFEKKSY